MTNPKRDDPDQSKLFIKKAREVGADESGSEADRLLGHLGKKPPAPKHGVPKRRRLLGKKK